ncbi:hypothetical protein DIPPA_11638 [Diplonema papillatum]|nr:hypothetical protein DIPPA_11638 [Diplonema papillatum]
MFGLWDATVGDGGATAVELFLNDVFVMAKLQPELLVLHLAMLMVALYLVAQLPIFAGIAFKIRCYCAGFIHFWACRESKVGNTDRTTRPAHLASETDVEEKEFIFIRHGESEWNEIFNRGKVFLLPRLLVGIVYEIMYLPFKDRSVFLDSCLGNTGVKQAHRLRAELSSPALSFLLQQGSDDKNVPKSMLATSNLRRCMETALIALAPRLEKTKEPVYIYSCLQEAARNVDTLALTPAKETGVEHWKLPHKELLNKTYNYGSKRWFERAIKRMTIFLKFAFAREEQQIIVVGHSLYFKKFFDEYLEKTTQHPEAVKARSRKLSNCGVVRFRMQQGKGALSQTYRIVPETIKVIYGSWV